MNRKLLLIVSAVIIMQLSSGFASDQLVPGLQDKGAPNSPRSTAINSDILVPPTPSPSPEPAPALNEAGEDVATAQGFVLINPSHEDIVNTPAQSRLSLVARLGGMTFEELKALDQDGSKLIGERMKKLVEEKIPGGKTITAATILIARKCDPSANSLTEVLVDKVRAPLALDHENYPKSKAGIIGQKLQAAIKMLPYGPQVAAGARALAQRNGKDTLSEVLIDRIYGSSPTATDEQQAAAPASEQSAEPKPGDQPVSGQTAAHAVASPTPASQAPNTDAQEEENNSDK